MERKLTIYFNILYSSPARSHYRFSQKGVSHGQSFLQGRGEGVVTGVCCVASRSSLSDLAGCLHCHSCRFVAVWIVLFRDRLDFGVDQHPFCLCRRNLRYALGVDNGGVCVALDAPDRDRRRAAAQTAIGSRDYLENHWILVRDPVGLCAPGLEKTGTRADGPLVGRFFTEGNITRVPRPSSADHH